MPPPLAKRAKWLEQLNDQPYMPLKYTSQTSDYVLCTYCEKSFVGSQKSQLIQHLAADIHKTNKELKKKRKTHQATLEEVSGSKPKSPAEVMNKELCEVFLAADIPIKKMDSPYLRSFLEKYIGKTMPSESMLRKKCANLL